MERPYSARFYDNLKEVLTVQPARCSHLSFTWSSLRVSSTSVVGGWMVEGQSGHGARKSLALMDPT